MTDGLVLRRLEKRFGTFTAVDAVDLDVEKGKLTALLGPSGCGKTTLLRMIAGLEAPTSGRILLDGEDITHVAPERRRFGMVFQSFALFPHLSVGDNISYSMRIAGVPKADRQARVGELLSLVRLEGYGERRISALSGGQKQRVAMARALAQEPSVFLLDEPMSALDAKLREEMQVELRLLQQKLKITTIVVTHDQREAMTMADTIVVMSKGMCEQVGPPREIYQAPRTHFVASFIGKANLLPATVRDDGVELAGHLIALAEPPRFRRGAEVVMSCRPESVVVHRLEAPNGNALPANVDFVRDVGPTKEVFLSCGDLAFTCEVPTSNPLDLTVGERVHAEFPAGTIRLYPAEPIH